MARVKTKRFYVVGIKGKIVGIYNDPIEASCHGKSRTPIFEFVPVNMVGIQASSYQPLLSSPSRKAERTIVADLAHKFYGKRDDYGCFGDVIQISRHRLPSGYLYVVDSMMWRAYIKPGLASDLVLFVQDRTGKIFLILIRRKNEPGAGTIAAPGGFLNVGVYDIETGVRCALREGSEEISVGMFPRSPDHKYQDDPNF